MISDTEFVDRHRFQATDFTRKCRLQFSNTLIFIINFVKGALQRELDSFFQVLKSADVAERVVSKSAFCAARKKLKPSAFVELSEHLIRRWYRLITVKRWQGLALRSVDGTTLRLPDTQELIDVFGQMAPALGKAVTMARVSHLYDPLNGLVLDAIIAPYHRDERSLLVEHLEKISAGTLLLLDAGYPAFWLFALFQVHKISWCARMPISTWKVVQDFLASGRHDDIVTLHPTPKMRAECAKHGAPATPIRVRLVRVQLSTGETEVLMTSLLDQEEYPTEVFSDLYFMRWGHEEHYKRFKSRMEVENWSGKTPLAIYQDFFAKVFSLNLTMVLVNAAQDIVDISQDEEKHPNQVNVTHALCAMKNAIVLLITHLNPLPLLRTLIDVMSHTVEPIRPQRSYPRRKGPRLQKYSANYKPCA